MLYLMVNTSDYDTGRYVSLKVNVEEMSEVHTAGDTFVPIDLARDVLEYRVVEDKYWYWSEAGSATYLSLNKNPIGYMVFQKSKELLEDVMPDIISKSFELFTQWGGGEKLPKIDFVSLGMGGMEKETEILRRFITRYRSHTDMHAKLTFVPVDMSLQLMSSALKTIDIDFRKEIAGKNLEIKPCLTDFTRTRAHELTDNPNRFMTAFGIVYNASFPQVLGSFKKLMTSHSLLLIDLDIVGDRSEDEILASYNKEDNKKFLFSSIDILHKASHTDVPIRSKFGRTLLGNLMDFEKCSYENGEVITELISEDIIDSFIAKYKLPPSAKNRIRISKDPHDKTVAIVYKPHPNGYEHSIVLGYSTRFDYDGFEDKLFKNGFDIVGRYGPKSNSTYFLLKLSDETSKKKSEKTEPAVSEMAGKST